MILLNNIINREYYLDDLITNSDDVDKNLKKIEATIRSSRLYKDWVYTIRDKYTIVNCDYFVDKNFNEDVDLEVHHIIFLSSIVKAVAYTMISNLKENEYLTIYDIIERVLQAHMADMIPNITLSTTIHQLYHTGQYSLHKDSKALHLGNYKKLLSQYGEFFNNDDIQNLTYFLNDIQKEEVLEMLR